MACPDCGGENAHSANCPTFFAQSSLNQQQELPPLCGDVDIEYKARLVIEMWDAFTMQDEPWNLALAIEYLRRALEMK